MLQASRPAVCAVALLAAGLSASLLGACREQPAEQASPRSLAEIEQIFQQVRALGDQVEVTRSRGAATSTDGVALAELVGAYNALRIQLQQALERDPDPQPQGDDARALEAMRHALEL